VAPLQDKFEVSERILRSDHANRFSGAIGNSVLPLPRILGTIDVDKIITGQRLPIWALTIHDSAGDGFVSMEERSAEDQYCHRRANESTDQRRFHLN
jgi:hypothetical protein